MEYKEYLTKWAEEVLSVPHELLNSLPVCPFAKAAILKNEVTFIRTSDYNTDIPEKLALWNDNNGKYNIVIAQRLHSINEASRSLARDGYYINWSDALYDDVVRWRFESDRS